MERERGGQGIETSRAREYEGGREGKRQVTLMQ